MVWKALLVGFFVSALDRNRTCDPRIRRSGFSLLNGRQIPRKVSQEATLDGASFCRYVVRLKSGVIVA